MYNVANTKFGTTDEISLELLCERPHGVPRTFEFKGIGLKQIDADFRSKGVEIAAYIVDFMPWDYDPMKDKPLLAQRSNG